MNKILFILRKNEEASARFRALCYSNFLERDYEISYFYVENTEAVEARIIRSISKIFRIILMIWCSRKYDVVIMQRPMTSNRKSSAFFEKILYRFNNKLIFDIDDAIFVPNPTKVQAVLRHSYCCICGNSYIKDYCNQYNRRSIVIPTGIDVNKFKPRSKSIEKSTITIGWTGTSGNYQYFSDNLKRDLSAILSSRPEVEFLIISDRKPDASFAFPYKFIQWSPGSEVSDLQKIDIGIMPLQDTEWARGKCGFKIIQYGSIGIPSVASPVGVNQEILLDHKTGYLVVDDEWRKPLERLINNASLRRKMGSDARMHIESNFSVANLYRDYKSVIDSTISGSWF